MPVLYACKYIFLTFFCRTHKKKSNSALCLRFYFLFPPASMPSPRPAPGKGFFNVVWSRVPINEFPNVRSS